VTNVSEIVAILKIFKILLFSLWSFSWKYRSWI